MESHTTYAFLVIQSLKSDWESNIQKVTLNMEFMAGLSKSKINKL